MTKEKLKNRVLNGGRGSGQSLRVLIEVYENKIVDLEQKNKDLADCNARLLSQAAAATKRVIQLEKDNWHDLRKDPNDLPKGYKAVLNQEGKETLYDPKRGFLGLDGVGVIAWCEIPKFEEAAK